jgi:hypothetical protein
MTQVRSKNSAYDLALVNNLCFDGPGPQLRRVNMYVNNLCFGGPGPQLRVDS